MKKITLSLLLMMLSMVAAAEKIGSVDTDFRLIGPDNKIEIEAFDDEGVPGVTCYISRATTGGVKGAVGLAEDGADASLSCHQTGPIALSEQIKAGKEEGENVFKNGHHLFLNQCKWCVSTTNNITRWFTWSTATES
jgi:CreA protein